MNLQGNAMSLQELRGKLTGVHAIYADAYEIAVRNGFEGTVEEWLESLKGKSSRIYVGSGEMPEGYSVQIDPTGDHLIIKDENGNIYDVPALKGDPGYTPVKGVDYCDGYTPVKGVDYFDGLPGQDGADGSTPHIGENGNWFIGDTDTGKPSRGIQGEPGKDGQNGQDGYTPVKGKDYFDGEDGQPGKDGEPGKDGADGVSATHSWNGTVLTITSASGTSSADLKGEKGETGAQGIQGEKGADGAKGDKGDKGDTGANGQNGADGKTPIKGVDYFTEADKNELVLMVINALGGNPVFGIVDENNNIIVSGNLANGTYTVKYEMEDGSTVNIGNLVLDNNVYYSVTNNLTNCTNSNSASKATQGDSYSATITAKSGYELESVTVTMGGNPVSVSGGSISIANVTGNIVITAVAEEIQTEPAEPTNFAEPNTTNKTDWSIWCNDARFGSDGAYRACTGKNNAVSNYIPVQVGDVLYINGMNIPTTGTSMEQGLLFAKSDKTMASASYLQWYLDLGYTTVTSDESTAAIIDTSGMANHDNGAAIAYVRVSGKVTGTLDEVEIKIKRNGRWL